MGKLKILVIEDDLALAKGMTLQLEQAGYQVKAVTSAVLALVWLKKFLPAVIILDILLPQKDGFQLLAEVRQDPRLKLIPVVVASNLDQPKDRQIALSLGATEYLVKSNLTLSGLTDRVAKVIESSQ